MYCLLIIFSDRFRVKLHLEWLCVHIHQTDKCLCVWSYDVCISYGKGDNKIEKGLCQSSLFTVVLRCLTSKFSYSVHNVAQNKRSLVCFQSILAFLSLFSITDVFEMDNIITDEQRLMWTHVDPCCKSVSIQTEGL